MEVGWQDLKSLKILFILSSDSVFIDSIKEALNLSDIQVKPLSNSSESLDRIQNFVERDKLKKVVIVLDTCSHESIDWIRKMGKRLGSIVCLQERDDVMVTFFATYPFIDHVFGKNKD